MFSLIDTACIVTIICFTRMMYQICYEKEAIWYFENQFGVIGSSIICCSFVFNIYYFFKNKYNIDENGFLLTVTLLLGGLLSSFFYNHCLHSKISKYSVNIEENLFITSIAFLAVSLKMVMRGIIDITIPFTLLLGRYVWLDTRSLKEIIKLLKVRHMRILESSIILFIGCVLSSAIVSILHLQLGYEVFISLVYGLLILFPYRYIRNVIKSKK